MQRIDRIAALSSRSRFRIGALLVQPESLTVSLDGAETALEPRVMEVLVALAEHAGEVVSAEQLLVEVWRGTFYGDNPVHKAIAHLRKVFQDDVRSPRYIETIRKRGYRLIASVHYPDDYHRAPLGYTVWNGANPYVGLNAFDQEHANVFFGRSRATAELLSAIRQQIDNQRRFVLIVGASGCGKSSLLNAGVLPLLTQAGGFDGLQAMAVARCDLAGIDASTAFTRLAQSLLAWQLDQRPVFPPDSGAEIAEHMLSRPGTIRAAVEQAFWRCQSRELAARPHAHLFLLIDHAEALVADGVGALAEQRAYSQALNELCEVPRVVVVMIVRSDFYPALIERFPDLSERKQGEGHVDVLAPRAGEIAQIIRTPAALAGLCFEEHAETSERLDDVLRDATIAHEDALPMLQHTLQALYERRSTDGVLRFQAFREIGGLEGALSHRAEQVYSDLPEAAKRSLPGLLAQMIVMQPDSDRVSARRIPWSGLDAHAQMLAEAFVRARLFVADLSHGESGLRVTHEALLRRWSRAMDWTEDNRRLLQARARLSRAADRWVEEGRGADHLLNPGRPLEEALEAVRKLPDDLRADEHAFLLASTRLDRRRRLLRTAAITSLLLLALVSIGLAVLAARARNEAELRRQTAMQLSDFMLVELADKLRPLGNLALLGSISSRALTELEHQPEALMHTDDLINRSRALRTVGEVMLAQAKLPEAESAFARAVLAADAAYRQAPQSAAAVLERGTAAYWLGYFHYRQFQLPQADRHWRVYLQASEQLVQMDPTRPDWQIELSYALNNLGGVIRDRGQIDEALAHFRRSAEIKTRMLGLKPDNDSLRFELADTLSWISSAEESRGNLEAALAGYDEQIGMLRRLTTDKPDALVWQRGLATALMSRAKLAMARGQPEQARVDTDESIERLTNLTALEPSNRVWARDLAIAEMQAADIAQQLGDSERQRRHSLSARQLIVDNLRSGDTSLALQRLNAVNRLAVAQSGPAFDFQAADQAIADLERIAGSSVGSVQETIALARALLVRGQQRARIGLASAAEDDWRRVLALSRAPVHKLKTPELLAIKIGAHCLLGRLDEVSADAAWLAQIGYRAPVATAIDPMAQSECPPKAPNDTRQ